MKKIKKLLAMIMAMTMVLGMAITVSAAETTNVTIAVNNEDAATLYYDQIVMPDPTSTSGWKYVPEYASFFSNIDIDRLVAIAENGTENGSAENGTLMKAGDLADALENLRATVQTPENLVENNQFTVQSGGLYVVIPERTGYTYSPTLVYVEVNETGTKTVQTKGAENQIDKTVDISDGSVAPGDEVEYTVTVKYPYISANYTNRSFTITDTLTNGTFAKDELGAHKITVAGLGTENEDYSVAFSDSDTKMTISMISYDSAKAGSDIRIIYTVKVDNDVTSVDGLSNKVTSELKLTPDGEPIKTEHVVITNPVKVTFAKVSDDSDVTDNLPGAVFAVYKGVSTDETSNTLVSIVADAASTADVTLPEDFQSFSALLKADGTADGIITIDGLDAQENYYLVEIVAPAGYKVDNSPKPLIKGAEITPNPVTETKKGEDEVTTIVTDTYRFNDFTVANGEIPNTKLSSLPSTGGIGTTIFTIGGCAIMIAAAALYFVNRRKSEEN